MNYYKIFTSETFIGIACSGDFLTYIPQNDHLIITNDTIGQFIEYKNKLYRDTWMKPLPTQHEYTFINAYVQSITKEEYAALRLSIEKNEEISIVINPEPESEINYETPDTTIEFIRVSKLNEMSYVCRTTIENGFDLWISDNQYHHFSLTTQDQLNLMAASTYLETAELIPYHADGEPSKYYTVDEMRQIIAAANQFKTYHTTYYNSLKNYINSLSTIEEIAAITYGTKIPEEYQTEVLKAIEQEMISYENH